MPLVDSADQSNSLDTNIETGNDQRNVRQSLHLEVLEIEAAQSNINPPSWRKFLMVLIAIAEIFFAPNDLVASMMAREGDSWKTTFFGY
jgi:hypothetical protein